MRAEQKALLGSEVWSEIPDALRGAGPQSQGLKAAMADNISTV